MAEKPEEPKTKEPKTEEKKTEIKTKFENADEAYQTAVKAETPEEAAPAIGFLRDTIVTINKELADTSKQLEQQKDRIQKQQEALSGLMLKLNISDDSADEEEKPTSTDEISDILAKDDEQ